MNNEHSTLPPGTTFAGYTIRRLVGTGSTGTVYEATHPVQGQRTALKLLHPELTRDATVRSSLEAAELRAGRLQHPNIAAVEGAGAEDGRLWVASAYIDGISVAATFSDRPAIADEAVRIVVATADALDYAHRNGVLHGDVRPANILLEQGGGRAVLTDFAIVPALSELFDPSSQGNRLHYTAPERFMGSENDVAADVYALGVTLFQLLVGTCPYSAVPAAQMAHAHRMAAIPMPSALALGLSRDFDAVIERALAKDPNDRYTSCGELATAAARALAQHAHPPAAPNTPWHQHPQPLPTAPWPPAAQAPAPQHFRPSRRRRWPIIAAVAAAVAVIAGVAVVSVGFMSHNSQEREEARWQRPVVLPFSDLGQPHGITVDSTGTLYVVDYLKMPHVLALAPQSQHPQALPFPVNDLNSPESVAVDAAGNVYVTDSVHKRVVKLAAGTNSEQDLPFSGLSDPGGVAVDSAGNVYITDRYEISRQTGRDRVLKLPAGSHEQQELAFSGLKSPQAVAVDSAGNVYVADTFNKRVLKLDKGSNSQREVAFNGLSSTYGVAVDSAGNVYATTLDIPDPSHRINIFEHRKGKVFKLSSRTGRQEMLPFGDLNWPWGVAVDADGNVYVAEADSNGGNRVIKLPK